MTDTEVGDDRAPARYTAHGRETIDRMRDLAHDLFGPGDLADVAFAFHCAATALKYSDRAGLKGDAEVDRAKASWYLDMVSAALGEAEDPRSGRPGFVAWSPEPAPREGFAAHPSIVRLFDITRGTSVDGTTHDVRNDGLFIVGTGPDPRRVTWADVTPAEREQLARVGAGDVVDVLLDDGRIARASVGRVMEALIPGRHPRPHFVLLNPALGVRAERVRLPGGWRRKKGVRYHDHLGLKGQRVPFTCPVIADIMRLLNGTEMDAGVRQSVLGRLELLRAYNAQLRRNEGGR